VKIEKWQAFSILFAIVLLTGVIIGVSAFNANGVGGVPVAMGHSVDEIDWSKTINSNLAINGNISSSGVCIGSDCKTNWSQVVGSVAVSPYFNATGRVGYNSNVPSGVVGWVACDSGYVVSAVHQSYNAQSFFIDYVTCSPIPYTA